MFEDVGMPEEFDLLAEVADELGLPRESIPPVSRIELAIEGRGELSLLRWGMGEPQIVFLHGGGQNAHTWDLVAMQLGVAALAIDLPGHGHSYWRGDKNYWPRENALAVAKAMEEFAPQARCVTGMSLGGLTTIRLAARRPYLVRRAVVVDVTPGVMRHNQSMTRAERGTTALIQDERVFDGREQMIAAAIKASPRRPSSAVRRGVLNNSRQLADGRWTWRYDLGGADESHEDFTPLWDDLESIAAPVMLVRGGESTFVPGSDAAEFARRCPHARLEVVPGAGHSVQSDRPVELARLIADFIA